MESSREEVPTEVDVSPGVFFDDDYCRHTVRFPDAVKRVAYSFDGHGKFSSREWDLRQLEGEGFCWYHVELPRSSQKLAVFAQYLIDVLCPPLKLQDILALVSNGPFCGTIDGALVFRVNSAGPLTSKFTQRIAAIVRDNMVISVSLGCVPRLDFSRISPKSFLMEVPSIEPICLGEVGDSHHGSLGTGGVVIPEHVLEFLLTMSHHEHADNAVPKGVGNLLVHIIDTHVDQLHDTVLHLETHLDDVERSLDTGVGATKKQMLDDRRFPKMHLDLQRLLQVIAHGDQVFPRVREKCVGKAWCTSEDLATLEVLVARLQKLKENVGFIANRITAIQAGLDSWQAEQINRKLYYLSFLSVIFLPLSVVTGAFGMNVGGVPWTKQTDPTLLHGFQNVLLLCTVIVMLLLAGFGAGPLYIYFATRHKHQVVKAKWLGSKRSFQYRGSPHYLQL
ncbi:unnamed protein product [Sphagnum compactum]